MTLAIFDLDNTLLAGDSDYLWGRFLVEQGVVDGSDYESRNQEFYNDYKAGQLDIFAFLEFSLAPLTRFSMAELQAMHAQYMQDMINALITPQAQALVDKHRQQGHTLLIITATNSFVTRPIAAAFGIPNLLATEPEILDGRYTGKVSGIPCFQDGKVKNLHNWLRTQNENLQDSWFYSDSHNDLPLLREVTHPIVVDPDSRLRVEAEHRHWPILALHDGSHAR